MKISKQLSRRLFGALLVAVGVTAASPSTGAWTTAPTTNSGVTATSPAIGAWTTASPADTWVAVPPADTGRYGSGTLDSWAGYSERISTPQIIRAVVAQDGILAFGDSIGVSTFADLAGRLYSSGTRLAMNAKSGRPTAPTVDILSRWATIYHLPTRILMAVGTNDIFNPPAFLFGIRARGIIKPDGPGVSCCRCRLFRYQRCGCSSSRHGSHGDAGGRTRRSPSVCRRSWCPWGRCWCRVRPARSGRSCWWWLRSSRPRPHGWSGDARASSS